MKQLCVGLFKQYDYYQKHITNPLSGDYAANGTNLIFYLVEHTQIYTDTQHTNTHRNKQANGG